MHSYETTCRTSPDSSEPQYQLFVSRFVGYYGLPPLSPNLNAFAERFVRSIKEECLGKMIFVGQESLRRAIGEYMAHYHGERNHQELGSVLIQSQPPVGNDTRVHRRQRLGGMLNYYPLATA